MLYCKCKSFFKRNKRKQQHIKNRKQNHTKTLKKTQTNKENKNTLKWKTGCPAHDPTREQIFVACSSSRDLSSRPAHEGRDLSCRRHSCASYLARSASPIVGPLLGVRMGGTCAFQFAARRSPKQQWPLNRTSLKSKAGLKTYVYGHLHDHLRKCSTWWAACSARHHARCHCPSGPAACLLGVSVSATRPSSAHDPEGNQGSKLLWARCVNLKCQCDASIEQGSGHSAPPSIIMISEFTATQNSRGGLLSSAALQPSAPRRNDMTSSTAGKRAAASRCQAS